MPIIRRDQNELRYNSLWLLPKDSNFSYWKMLFKNAKAFFYGMGYDGSREGIPNYIEELDFLIHEKIEKVMGIKIQGVLITYKNLPTHNSFTRSRNPVYHNMNIYKFTIEEWLDEIEGWIFQRVTELEKDIRFTTPARQYI